MKQSVFDDLVKQTKSMIEQMSYLQARAIDASIMAREFAAQAEIDKDDEVFRWSMRENAAVLFTVLLFIILLLQ